MLPRRTKASDYFVDLVGQVARDRYDEPGRVGDYLPIRVAELVIHSLDLARAVELDVKRGAAADVILALAGRPRSRRGSRSTNHRGSGARPARCPTGRTPCEPRRRRRLHDRFQRDKNRPNEHRVPQGRIRVASRTGHREHTIQLRPAPHDTHNDGDVRSPARHIGLTGAQRPTGRVYRVSTDS